MSKKQPPRKRPAPKAKATTPKVKGTAVAIAKLKEQAKSGPKPRLWTEEDMETLIECALLGYTNAEICVELDMSEAKFYEFKAAIVEIGEALTRARRKTNTRVVKAMLARAEGGVVKETQAIKVKLKGGGEDVKVVETEKYIPPDTAAGIYWLNNRARDHWKQFKAHEHTGPNGGAINHQVSVPEKVMDYLRIIKEELK